MMKDNLVYLKPNVVIEPLFDKWYAWAHLISPATAAMNLLERHLKIMESYIEAPELHEEAAKNPAMLGGPFMDYAENKVIEISALRDFILSERNDLIDLAGAVQQLFGVLKDHSMGYSLESLYKKVPDILKGYVELTCDLNNNPTFRFYEQLLYKSKYYKEECQSISLYLIDKDERPFVLSTPRIEGEDVLHLPLAFKDKRIDQLFKMQRVPGRYETIREQFELTPEEEVKFRSLFTEEATEPYRKYTGNGVRIRYFGHACILTETQDVSILTDPVISYGYDADVKRFTYTDLPDLIDIVFITHNHQDHILFETMYCYKAKNPYFRMEISLFQNQFNSVMNFSIQSSRLLIRDFSKKDWGDLHHLYMMPETVKYNPSGYPENESATRKLVDEWSEQQEAANREGYTVAIIDKADGSFVGVISLDLGDAKYRKAEVWYKLLPEYWGRGYATEAVSSMVAFGFGTLKLHRIECGCSIHNIGSYRVMEKVGMTREGIKRKVLPLEDGWHDAYIYSILASESAGTGK